MDDRLRLCYKTSFVGFYSEVLLHYFVHLLQDVAEAISGMLSLVDSSQLASQVSTPDVIG